MGGLNGTPNRLLVVSYHFPSDGAVGGLRWAGLTKYLGRLGWRSWIVTAAPAPAATEAGVTVVSLPRFKTLNERLLEYRHASRRRKASAAAPAGATSTVPPSGAAQPRGAKRLVRELGFFLTVPDAGRGWVFRAAARIRKLIAEVRPDVLVSSGPPHSAHVAAWLATRGMRTPWYADLRDPWAGPITAAWKDYPWFQSPVFMGVNRLLERVVLRSTAGVICNTRELASAIRERHPRVHTEWIPNAVDRETLPSAPGVPPHDFPVAYVGTIYGGRNLVPVLCGLGRFLERHPEASGPGTKLRIAGAIDDEQLASLRQATAALRMEDRVEILGRLPREDALRLVAGSRVAIVLAQEQEWQVPAKLYEMVALAPVTLVVASEHSAARSEASRLGARAVQPDDLEGIAQVFTQAWQGHGLANPSDSLAADYRNLAPGVAEWLKRAGDGA